jgi:hypothetical protein
MSAQDAFELLSGNLAEAEPIRGRLGADAAMPLKTSTHIFVTVAGEREFRGVGVVAELTPAGAAISLRAALSEGLAQVGLPVDFIEVTADLDSVILTSATITQASPLVASLKFSNETAQFLNSEAWMDFPVASRSSYTLTPDKYGEDPFEPHYPLNILSDDHGTSSCHVEGLGRVPCLAFLRDPQTIISADIRFMAGDTQLSARFVDKYLNPVRFKLDTKIYLTFQLNPSA